MIGGGRAGILRALAACLASGALAACGYASVSIVAIDSDLSGWWVEIESPTTLPEWRAPADEVLVAGRSFVPQGSSCYGSTGTIAAGYRVAWLNGATGQTGLASMWLDCLDVPAVRWDAGRIPLAAGSNPITVTASDADGRAGSDALVVWAQ